jgi:protein TonB
MNFKQIKRFSKFNLATFIVLFFWVGSNTMFAQDILEPAGKDKVLTEDLIYSNVEVAPVFPGGMQKFNEFISHNYKIPNVKNLKGKIYIQFVIEKDGALSAVKVLRDVGHGTGAEALRVLALSPKWKPGIQNGKLVRVLYSIPISIGAK